MHFSTSSTSAPQIEPSAGGIFTKRSLLFMPRPQVALQTSHSPHSVTRQLLGAEPAKQSQDSLIVHLCSHLLHSSEAGELTALLVDQAVLGLLRRQRADGAVVWELLHVTLPGTRAHPAGRAARRPCDPLRHHTGGGI